MDSKTKKRLRLVTVVALLLGIYAYGQISGAAEEWSLAALRAEMEGAGLAGFGVYVMVFVTGQLMGVPAWLFFIAAAASYGPFAGFGASLLGALCSVSLTFGFVRGVGGQPLAEIEQPLIRKMMARLETRPLRTMIALRLIFISFPPMNYALAMSGVRFRDYFLAALVGVAPPIVGIVLLTDLLIEYVS